jgi:AsmA protein
VAARIRLRRVAWIGLAAAAVLIIGMVGFVGWTLNPASLKPRLIEAARRATGRELTISGATGIKLSLVPTITMDDVALANPPGFSRPEMVKIGRVELSLALLPLLHHRFEVEHVTLVRPDTVLETDRSGRANWVFTRQAPPTPNTSALPPPTPPPAARTETVPSQSVPAAAPATAARKRFTVTFKGASVVDGRFGWIDGKSGHQYFAGTSRLTIDSPQDGPVRLTGTVLFDGRTIAVTGSANPAEMSGAGFLPVALKLETGGATLTADGKIAGRGRGYAIAVSASVPDPSVLAPFFSRLPLAALRDVTAHADLVDSGGPVPSVSALQVKVGSVDLDTPGFVRLGHGARLNDVNVTARGDTPINVEAGVTISGVASTLSGTIGDLGWLAAGASAPVAVDLAWHGASAQGLVKGTVQRPASLAGVALDVAVDVPDPSQVMNDAPPALKDVVFRARLTDAPGPTPFQLSSSAGDLAGQLRVSKNPRLSVEGQVWSRYLDLDLLRGLPATPGPGMGSGGPVGAPLGAPPTGTGAGGPLVSGSRPADAPPAVPSAKPHAAPVASNTPLIPDTKLPFDLIRAVDGNVKFTFGDVRVDGADIRKIDGVVTAKDGLLRVDPFTISALAQSMSGILVADASKSPPVVHVAGTAPGLALFPLFAALGLPQAATGHAAVQADLTGSGDTPRALAASANGWAGMAVEDGQVDARMVNSWLGQLQPLHIGGSSVTDVKCFAMRADAKDGVVTIQPMALDTAALIVEGNGDVDLRRETLSMRLRPRARIGGAGIALPVRVTGPIRDPSVKIDISSKGVGGGALAGLIIGGGKDVMGAAGGGDPCPAALARARASGPGEGAPK